MLWYPQCEGHLCHLTQLNIANFYSLLIAFSCHCISKAQRIINLNTLTVAGYLWLGPYLISPFSPSLVSLSSSKPSSPPSDHPIRRSHYERRRRTISGRGWVHRLNWHYLPTCTSGRTRGRSGARNRMWILSRLCPVCWTVKLQVMLSMSSTTLTLVDSS